MGNIERGIKMNINRYTKIFINNIMLRLGNEHLSLTNRKHVLCAVKKAYGAMSPRTLGRGRRPGARIYAPTLTTVLSTLANDFVDYFSKPAPKTQADFDDWHKTVCDKFLTNYNALLSFSGYTRTAKYGKAQKIVNIAFKYLYLFCDIVPGKPGHFTFCHFAIDSITLVWYKKHIDPKCSVGNWSDMTYGEYIEIQKNIRAYISKNMPDKTPFEAEFEIWSDLYYGK